MSYRASKIRDVIQDDDRYPEEFSKSREIQRIAGDYRIRQFAEREIRDVETGIRDADQAARRIDEEQEFHDRHKGEEGKG